MRRSVCINEDWLFSKGRRQPNENGFEKIDLPHTWNGTDGQDGGGDYYRGEGTYVKRLPDVERAEGDRVYIEFCGVNSSAELVVNSKSCKKHDGGYSLWRADITDYLAANNTLTVYADNSPNDRVYPQFADFTFYGGIYRDVNIVVVPRVHFDMDYYGSKGVKITPVVDGSRARVAVQAFVSNLTPQYSVRFSIFDSGEELVSAEADGENCAQLTINRVHLWDGVKDPYLYTLKSGIYKDGELVDEVSLDFGCRSFSVDSCKGFFLNSRSYPLRGVCRHQDRPGKGNALSRADHEEDMALIRELGANTLRLAHYQHDEYFYTLCDRAGIVVWAEIPYISRHMPAGRENTLSMLRELIVQNYHHPSIVVWGLSNEISMGGSNDKDMTENHRLLNELAHSLDSTRLTTAAVLSMCPPEAEYTKIPDLISYNHYFGWYGGDTSMNGEWFDRFHRQYPRRAVGLSEYGCEALNWHSEKPEQGDYTEEYQSYYHEELIRQISSRKYLWATHLWNMFDFAADARSEGGENGINHKGLVSFDRKYKKDAFYAYKAMWSEQPVLHVCSKRFVDRTEDETLIKVYSNCAEVSLYINGTLFEIQSRGEYPFFNFMVPNRGESLIEAISGSLSDEIFIRKTDKPNESYIMKEEHQVINWFELERPEGRFSVFDKIGDLLDAPGGKLFIIRALPLIICIFKSAKGAGGMAGSAGLKPNRELIQMARGFTFKRLLSMAGAGVTKEHYIKLNQKLNTVKKRDF